MNIRILVLAGTILALTTQVGFCETPSFKETSKEVGTNLLLSLSAGDVVRVANDFRGGCEALARFAESLNVFGAVFAESTIEISKNSVEMSADFDPFGMKESFRMMHLQHETIMAQSEKIQELQRQEIGRLRAELEEIKAKK